jgi:hypothetical protein
LEFTSDAIAEMIENCSDELVKFAEKPYIQTQKQLLENDYSEMNELLFKMLDKFSTMH